MNVSEDIFSSVKTILVELFEIEEELIVQNAFLYEDLDVDSIDAVDLIVKLKEVTGKKVNPEDFKSVRTVADVVKAVENVLES